MREGISRGRRVARAEKKVHFMSRNIPMREALPKIYLMVKESMSMRVMGGSKIKLIVMRDSSKKEYQSVKIRC